MSTEIHKCCRMVYGQGCRTSFPCGNKAKIQHEGRWFCGIHDPVKRKAKQDAKRAKLEAEWKERDEHRKATQEALERANGTCEWKEERGESYWDTGCDQSYSFDYAPPYECGYKFCPSCGKKIVFVKLKREDDEE